MCVYDDVIVISALPEVPFAACITNAHAERAKRDTAFPDDDCTEKNNSITYFCLRRLRRILAAADPGPEAAAAAFPRRDRVPDHPLPERRRRGQSLRVRTQGGGRSGRAARGEGLVAGTGRTGGIGGDHRGRQGECDLFNDPSWEMVEKNSQYVHIIPRVSTHFSICV